MIFMIQRPYREGISLLVVTLTIRFSLFIGALSAYSQLMKADYNIDNPYGSTRQMKGVDVLIRFKRPIIQSLVSKRFS